MYEIARRVQRKRDHTESFLSFGHPFLGTSRPSFGNLLQYQETLLQPEADWNSGPIVRVEILTLVQAGSIAIEAESQDSTELEVGSVHYLCSGPSTEFQVKNLSRDNPGRYCQIWLDAEGVEAVPRTESLKCEPGGNKRELLLLASGQGDTTGIPLNQDVAVYHSRLRQNEHLIFETLHSRRVFLAVLSGLVRLEEHRLQDSDSAMIWRENLIEITAQQRTTLLLIDLP